MQAPDFTLVDVPPDWDERDTLDLSPETPIFLIGWIDTLVPAHGPVGDAALARLFEALERRDYLSDNTRGSHSCELCPTPMQVQHVRHGDQEARVGGHGFFLVEHQGKAYAAPPLLLHYVLDHGYRPPDEFLEAVLGGRFVDTRSYAVNE